MTDMKLYDWHFPDPEMEAVYITDATPGVFSPACGICPDLSAKARRAREMECRTYAEYPEMFTFTQRILRVAGTVEEVNEDAVRALRLVLEDEAPDWIAEVWAARAFEVDIPDDDTVSLVTGIPLQAVVAISRRLEEW